MYFSFDVAVPSRGVDCIVVNLGLTLKGLFRFYPKFHSVTDVTVLSGIVLGSKAGLIWLILELWCHSGKLAHFCVARSQYFLCTIDPFQLLLRVFSLFLSLGSLPLLLLSVGLMLKSMVLAHDCSVAKLVHHSADRLRLCQLHKLTWLRQNLLLTQHTSDELCVCTRYHLLIKLNL